ncbi:MAG: 16S rRNA (guanine(966)-N(2))-methyltransferase RsmD [Spirochaetaceae bacterium]
MRVTGGEYGGRRIVVPPGEIRPAMDRMRESVFSILGSALGSLEGVTVLDLFSGSGSMALEALSRGARYAVLVERDRGKADVVRQNLSYVEAARWKLVIAPVERYLKRAVAAAGSPFELVFCDPPFRYPGKAGLLARIAAAGVLNAEGRLVVHFPREDELGDDIVGLELVDTRAYGRSIVHMYEVTAGP